MADSKNPGAGLRHPVSPTEQLKSFTPLQIEALATAGAVMLRCLNEGQLTIKFRPGAERWVDRLVDGLYQLQDNIHGSSAGLEEALAQFVVIANSAALHAMPPNLSTAYKRGRESLGIAMTCRSPDGGEAINKPVTTDGEVSMADLEKPGAGQHRSISIADTLNLGELQSEALKVVGAAMLRCLNEGQLTITFPPGEEGWGSWLRDELKYIERQILGGSLDDLEAAIVCFCIDLAEPKWSESHDSVALGLRNGGVS